MSDLEDLFQGAEKDVANAPERKRLENERQAEAMAAARKEGWHAFKISAHKRKGFLDAIYIKPWRKIAFIEYKVPPNEATALQEGVIAILNLCGFHATVCYDTDDTMEFLRKVDAETTNI